MAQQRASIAFVHAKQEETDGLLDLLESKKIVLKRIADRAKGIFYHSTVYEVEGATLDIYVVGGRDSTGSDIIFKIKDILQHIRPTLVVMTGMLAGRKDEGLKLGDLVVAKKAFIVKGKSTPDNFISDLNCYEPKPFMRDLIAEMLSSRNTKIIKQLAVETARTIEFDFSSTNIQGGTVATFLDGVHTDMDATWWERLKERDRELIAMEMESALFYQTVAQDLSADALFVKGVMDYGTPEKGNGFKAIANHFSAVFAWHFIESFGASFTQERSKA